MNLAAEVARAGTGISADEILASHFTLIAVPGAIQPIETEGAEGWTSPNPHPVLSLMRWTTADPASAEAALDAVLARFRAEGRGVDWMTGPRCEQAGLLSLLQSRGFFGKPLRIAAMARAVEPVEDVAPPDGVTIRRVEGEAADSAAEVMAKGFDIPIGVARIYHDAYLAPSPLQRTDVYTATPDGGSDPVGVGYLSFIGDGPTVLMRVSATLESHRGRGIYHALIRQRLAEAAREGRGIAVVHAYSDASRRALADLGFGVAGELLLHRWRP